MDIHEWMKSNEKKQDDKPKISDFKEDILLLKDNGFINKDVKRYLKEVKNYEVSEVYISKYIRKIRGETDEKKEKKTQKVSQDEKSETDEAIKKAKMDEFFTKNNKGR